MNILVVGKFYVEAFASHIAETFELMGHSVLRHQPGRTYRSANQKWLHLSYKAYAAALDVYERTPAFERQEMNRLKRVIDENQLDFVLVCHDFLSPAQVKLFRALEIPIAMWYPDAVSTFRKCYFAVADYNYLFFKDRYITDVLAREYGLVHTVYLPEAANVALLKDYPLSPADVAKFGCDVALAGNLHTFRVALLEQLPSTYQVKVWGLQAPHWLDTHKISPWIMNYFVANEEKAKAFRAAKINLNTLHPGEIHGVNVRTFEISACGAFQLCNARRDLAELYLSGQEIVTFENVTELREKIEYYLRHEEERQIIAERAKLRTLRDHSYQHRLQFILNQVIG